MPSWRLVTIEEKAQSFIEVYTIWNDGDYSTRVTPCNFPAPSPYC